MEKGLGNEKMSPVLKTKQKRPSSLKHATLANHWESGESDTESLAQERAYQQQLQMRLGHHDQNQHTLPQKNYADSLQQGNREEEDDDATEELRVYDSLEAESNPTLLQTQYLDAQADESEGSQLLSDDAHSDLHYDPTWRTNLKGNGSFDESVRISVEEYNRSDTQGLAIKGGYRYIVDASPAVLVTPHVAGNDQPYHLHPRDSQSFPQVRNHVLQSESPEADLSGSARILNTNETDGTLQDASREQFESSIDRAGKSIIPCPETTEDTHAAEFQPTRTRRPIQNTSAPKSTSPQVLLNKKLERLMEDIVERNKITLGCRTSKCGSYVRAHALKQEVPHHVNEVHETLKEMATAENQNPETWSLQKTQQLQLSKGKKAQQKEYHDPSQQQWPPALNVKAELAGCSSFPFARRDPQMMTSSQPLPPTIHLNISLDTSSHLLSLLQQKDQDTIINLASLCSHPSWSPASEVQLALSPGYQRTNLGTSHMSCEGLNVQLHHQNLQSSPDQGQSTTALQWPLVCKEEDQTWSSNEAHTKKFSQSHPRTQGLATYTVLPPIAKPMMGKEPKLSPGQSAYTTSTISRSSSDGYLVRLERQKQQRARVTQKQLKTDGNLRGLLPDYIAIEKTKMKRQKLYSNMIREQNKKISRIPFLLAKDPEGGDKKVPRMKALEYAKTIAKPPVVSQPKQRQKCHSEGLTEQAPYCNVSELTRLELLRKRHEEEKQVVALLRKVHTV